MDNKKFYLRIGDWAGYVEYWFETEKEMMEYLDGRDTTGLDVFAIEVNRVILNM